MKVKEYRAITYAIIAAALYAASSPASKMLLRVIPPAFMASLLYLGAGVGMFAVNFIKHKSGKERKEEKLTKKELPYTAGMVLLDIAAPIFLMLGLTMTTSANASLLNNFEIVATSLIALLVFKETISRRLWTAIFLITVSSIILSVEDISSFSFSIGSVFVLMACVCWGLENNCTRKLSVKDPVEIVIVKGIGSGAGSFIIAMISYEKISNIHYVIPALLLGFVAYGLSISLYIYAQRELGAAKTSAYYAVSPFIGTGLSLVMFREVPSAAFIIALVVMIVGAYFASTEGGKYRHYHSELSHEHNHNHNDGIHNHTHDEKIIGEHSHIHTHEGYTHSHRNSGDANHIHSH